MKGTKKLFLLTFILIVCIAFSGLFGCSSCKSSEDDEPPIESTLELALDQISLDLYESRTLLYDYNGEETVVWSSSNSEIVSVENGVIFALQSGEAVISIKTETIEDTCKVIVKAFDENNVTFLISMASSYMGINETASVVPTLKYKQYVVQDFSCTYMSSNTAVATVNDDGVVTAVAEGETDITAVLTYMGKTFYASTHIEVNKGYTATAEKIELNAIDSFGGNSYQNTKKAEVVVKKNNQVITTGYTIEWIDPQTDICSISTDGMVVGRSVGNVALPYNVKVDGVVVFSGSVLVEVKYVSVALSQNENLEISSNQSYDFTQRFTQLTGATIEKAEIYVGDTKEELAVNDGEVFVPDLVIGFNEKIVLYTNSLQVSFNANVYKDIADEQDMLCLQNATTGYYKLTQDIDMTDVEWTSTCEFSGRFNGQGYSIQNFVVKGENSLFSVVKNGAVIENLNMNNVTITSNASGGGLVGNFQAKSASEIVTINNVEIETFINGSGVSGGLFKSVTGKVLMRNVVATVYNSTASIDKCGALVAFCKGIFEFENTTVYSNLPLCSVSTNSANSGHGLLNATENVLVDCKEKQTLNVGAKDLEKISLDNDIVSWSAYVGAQKQEGSGNIYIPKKEYVEMVGGSRQILIVAKTATNTIPYLIHTSYTKEIGQDNIADLAYAVSGKVLLIEDIDMSNYGNWTNENTTPFTGVFDGQGHVIKNLTTTGLFNGFAGTIQNVGFSNASYVGVHDGIIADNIPMNSSATISNVIINIKGGVGVNHTGAICRYIQSGASLTLENVVIQVKRENAASERYTGFIAGMTAVSQYKPIKATNCYFVTNNVLPTGLREDTNWGIGNVSELTTQTTTPYTAYDKYFSEESTYTLVDYTTGLTDAHKENFSDEFKALFKKSDNKVYISTLDDFELLKTATNGTYVLENDIDMSTYGNWESEVKFTGVLDGQGHVIKNLKTSGLFKDFAGTIMNVGFIDASYIGSNNGIIADRIPNFANAVVSNVIITGVVVPENATYTGVIARHLQEAAKITLENVLIEVEGVVFNGVAFGFSNYLAGYEHKITAKNCYFVSNDMTLLTARTGAFWNSDNWGENYSNLLSTDSVCHYIDIDTGLTETDKQGFTTTMKSLYDKTSTVE